MTVISSPDGIEFARLSSIKYQLRLEQAGMKSSGGALRPRLAKEFNLSSRAPHADYIAVVQARMDTLLEGESHE